MPYIPVLGVVQAEFVQSLDTQIIENVLHFKPDGLPDPTEMAELGAYLAAWWNTSMKIHQPTVQSLTVIKLTDLSSAISPVVTYGTGMPIAGTNASPALPNNCALCITKRTALRGRSYRGRYYFGALNEASVTANVVSPGLTAGVVSALNLLRSFSTASAEWTMGVISRYFEKNPRPAGIYTPITSHDTDGIVDSQRRRLPRRGA